MAQTHQKQKQLIPLHKAKELAPITQYHPCSQNENKKLSS